MTQHHAPRPWRLRGRPAVALLAAALGVAALAPVAGAATLGGAGTHAAKGIEIKMFDGPFGPQLVVGSGPLAGFALYAITSDTATTFGCTTVPFHFPGGGGTFPCTGPTNPDNSEWPALTTTAAPIAGAGVHQSMLHSVYRKGIGHQVTYNGHPLYLFDTTPGGNSGEGWDEPTLPPWHGQWWLVSPTGTFLEWSQTLEAAKLANGTVALTALMEAGGSLHPFTLYSFSVDTGTTSYCGAACSRVFEPLLTTGTPGLEGTGVTGSVGTITRGDGTTQLTYDGHPLYLYSHEAIAQVPGRGLTVTGSGNGKTVGSGTFNLVTP